MLTKDFDYVLPEKNIAQAPVSPRDSCKLMVVHRKTGLVEHRVFRDIIEYLNPGDLLVVNQTRVLPARLLGYKDKTHGACEVLLLKKREDLDAHGFVWECLVKPGKRLKPGATILFYEEELSDDIKTEVQARWVLHAEILDFVEQNKGGRLVRFTPQEGMSFDEALHKAGKVPLPPYITQYKGDPEQYQTVYSMQEEHSAAAPTAGLHFTQELIERIKQKGVHWAQVELEVGIDTFRIVEEEDPTQHVMHTERYHISQDVIDAIHNTKAAGGRVIAVGTTAVRTLESAFDKDALAYETPCVALEFEDRPDSARVCGKGDVVAHESATTNLYLMPGSTFHVVDGLITNFHVPRSTLMMLVSAFASRDLILKGYEEAIAHDYRMLSFGDAMYIE